MGLGWLGKASSKGGILRYVRLVVPVVIAALLLVEAVLLAVAVLQIWPGVSSILANQPQMPQLVVLGISWTPGVESFYILLVVLLGGCGASVHALTSLATYVGNRSFLTSWALWYAIRLPVGVLLALILYLLLRGGLLSTASTGPSINPYAVAAISGLAGLFSKQATDKLEEVFSTIFQTKEGGDRLREDKVRENERPNDPQVDDGSRELGAARTAEKNGSTD